MGLFGSSKKTYYNSVSSILYDDTPSIIKQTVVSTITQNRNMAEDLLTNINNGIGYNANRLWRYGESGGYPWGLPNGSITHIAPQTMRNIEGTIEYEVGGSVVMVFSSVDVNPSNNHIIYYAEYYLTDSSNTAIGERIPWTYDESTNVYPSLSLELDDVSAASPYFPIIPIMQDQVYLAENAGTNKTAITRACRYLNLKPDDIHDAITADPDYGSNPVEDAFIIMSLAIDDDARESKEYLYRFFLHQYGFSRITQVDFDYWVASGSVGTPPINRLNMEDSNYKMELGWHSITQTLITGVVGEQGTYHRAYDMRGDVVVVTKEGSGIEDLNESYTYNDDRLVLQYQVSATQYLEVNVIGLVHANWIVGKETRTTLSTAFAATEDDVAQALIIPLRRDILLLMGAIKTHDVMYRSIRLVVNDKLTVKLKWYETGLFSALILIAGVVISIFNPPAGAAILSAAAIQATIVQLVLMKLLMPIAFKALQNVLGDELALVISTIVGLALGDNSTLSYVGATLSVASGLNSLKVANELEDIYAEIDETSKLLDEYEEELAQKQMGIDLAVGVSRSDSYGILDPESHVKRFRLEAREPLLIRETTTHYTEMLRFTDRPDSYIRLGHTGV